MANSKAKLGKKGLADLITSGDLIIVGKGRVGQALFTAVKSNAPAQYRKIVLLRGHTPKLFAREVGVPVVVVFAVPDHALADVSAKFGAWVRSGDVCLHTSGIGGAGRIQVERRGVHLGVMHPLLALYQAGRTQHGCFSVDGDRVAKQAAGALGHAAGWELLPKVRPGTLYHAAAVMTAAGTYSAISHGVEMMCRAGASEAEAVHALSLLSMSAAMNALLFGTPVALTGPMVRGDERVMRAHKAAIAKLAPKSKAAYLAMLRLAESAKKLTTRKGMR